MKHTLLATTAALVLAFGAFDAIAQSDRTDHLRARSAETGQHQPAGAERNQNPAAVTQQPAQAQRDRQVTGEQTRQAQPRDAQNAPAATQQDNNQAQPSRSQQSAGERGAREQPQQGGTGAQSRREGTQPAQSHEPAAMQRDNAQAQPRNNATRA